MRSQSTAQKTSKGESGVLLAVCQKHAPKQHTANPPGIPWISGKRQPPSDLYIYMYSYIFPSWWDVNHHITFPVWLIISPLMLTFKLQTCQVAGKLPAAEQQMGEIWSSLAADVLPMTLQQLPSETPHQGPAGWDSARLRAHGHP